MRDLEKAKKEVAEAKKKVAELELEAKKAVPPPPETLTPQSIHARYVAIVDAKEGEPGVLEDQVITISPEGKITGIVPRASFSGKIDVKLDTHIVTPGFVNCHTHTPMTLLRGYADDVPLQEWLFQHIFPTEGEFVFKELGEQYARLGTTLAIYEMLKSGTTLFNDMYYHGKVSADVIRKAGMRAVLAPKSLVWTPNPDEAAYAADVKENAEWCKEIVDSDKSGLIYPSFIPHAAYTVPEHKLREAKEKYDEVMQDRPYVIHTHCHETQKEVDDFQGVDGKSAVQTFDAVGMLRKGTVAAHCVAMTDEEIALFAKRGVSVAHNPRSNLKLASGIARIPKMLEAGVNVCLGTDGCASNNALDMLSEMQYCSLLAKGSTLTPDAVPALQALQIATINGARALGLDKVTGSITVGKAADLVAVDLGHLECAPIYDPLGALVYTNRRDVSHVWVNGKCLVQDRNVLAVKPDLAQVDSLVSKIHEFRKTMPGRKGQTKFFQASLCKCCAFRV